MALTNKLNAIANAIRNKTGKSDKLNLGQMVSEINSLKTTFSTQSKTVTPTKAEQTISPDNNYDGLSSVKVSAIPSNYIIPAGSQTITSNGTVDVTSLASVFVNVAGGSLPTGITAIACGTDTVTDDFTTASRTITHNLGVVPDFVMYWKSDGNIASTNTMVASIRSTTMGYRSSAYTLYDIYHGNSTTSVSLNNSNSSSIGVKSLTATTFQVASHSSTVYWRGGYTYKWIAIKF